MKDPSEYTVYHTSAGDIDRMALHRMGSAPDGIGEKPRRFGFRVVYRINCHQIISACWRMSCLGKLDDRAYDMGEPVTGLEFIDYNDEHAALRWLLDGEDE